MRRGGGGAIVNTASVAGKAGGRGYSVYSASKAGILLLTQCMALDFAADKIRVNAVCPGPTATRMVLGLTNAPDRERGRWANELPAGRMGQPEDAAKVVAYLASDDAAFVTGAAWVVDGGRLLTGIGQSTVDRSLTAAVHPSPFTWIVRFAPLVAAGAPVLDLACGKGRHTRFFLARGHPVIAVDIDVSGLDDLADHQSLEILRADLEDGSPWPLPGRRFGAVVVTNYLRRPLIPHIIEAVDAEGLLLYETFAVGNEAYGRPTNPDFLLRPGELLDLARGRLQIVAYEHGCLEKPRPMVKQRIAAVRREPPVALGVEA